MGVTDYRIHTFILPENLRLDTRESECILGNAIDASAVLKLNSLGSFVSGPLFRFNRFPGTRR